MYGIKQFDAIINPPQSGILAVGAGQKSVLVDGDETRIATIVTLSASFDHRVVDGAVGAMFMALLKRYLEYPALMLV
ncbi:pyruvate/2-oxoglutarate dehydrogenase complex dihydrolipoamide acyltransferase (E2) component [Pseudoteredinibacter isoporae]|uniref:Pyruvate/2-oxoglutarate dehydrogenase complex dihydrolipoamide acyltransferase (E2) component n=1 Tax=Pseudoteredinibacter isoporae TaxID=570281 RepID=A0A7X0JRM6_9GAMM|nr:pyruvate/2-oxoglutarate dehydrogenase complex dihydrolipoamide acyltransferase (E2) component [Pseudoteredinibacter isoporae]